MCGSFVTRDCDVDCVTLIVFDYVYEGVEMVRVSGELCRSFISNCSNEVVNFLVDKIPVNRSRGREVVKGIEMKCSLLLVVHSCMELASSGNDGNVREVK